MTTLDEKQTVPASDNRITNSPFFISQVLHFTINIVLSDASTKTMEERHNFTVNAITAFSGIEFGEAP
jgi:hypothetical protein